MGVTHGKAKTLKKIVAYGRLLMLLEHCFISVSVFSFFLFGELVWDMGHDIYTVLRACMT